MGSRTWIKIYSERWLQGSLRDETPELRGFWADILALAGNSSFGDSGLIQLADDVGLTDAQIAGIFKVPLDNWLQAKERLIETDRISCNGHGIISIINWTTYQSEYQRQRDYRAEYEKRKVTTQSNNAGLQRKVRGEGEGEGEGDREKKENKEPPIFPLLRGTHPKRRRNKELSSEERRQSTINTEVKHPGLLQGLSKDMLAEAARIRAKQNESSS